MANPEENIARGLRAEEQWLRYDSICIGPGAKEVSQSWFNSFAEFADADSLTWGDGSRTKQVGLSYCNQSGQSEDWAQRIYQSGVDFEAPPGILATESQSIDSGAMQEIFMRMLPEMMAFRVTMQDLDDVLIVPGGHLPSVSGVSGQSMNGAGFLIADAGQRGTGDMRNSWTWPEPLEVAAKSKLTVSARVDNPLVGALRGLVSVPGTKTLTVVDNLADPPVVTQVQLRNWYRIRVWHRGPRFVQLRGARSAG